MCCIASHSSNAHVLVHHMPAVLEDAPCTNEKALLMGARSARPVMVERSRGQSPAQLLMLEGAAGERLVARYQLLQLLQEGGGSANDSTIEGQVKRVWQSMQRARHAGIYEANQEAIALLKQAGVLAPRVRNAALLSLETAATLVDRLQLDPALAHSMRQLAQRSAADDSRLPHGTGGPSGAPKVSTQHWSLHGPPPHRHAAVGTAAANGVQHVAAAAAADGEQGAAATREPSASCSSSTFNPDELMLPAHLPPCHVPQEQLGGNYGLTTQADVAASAQAHVAAQLADMQAWSQCTFMASRPECFAKALSTGTWGNCVDMIHLFLGYCCMHEGVTQPCLQLYLNAHLFAAFIAFLLARGCTYDCLVQHATTARRVVAFLAPELTALSEWLYNLQRQAQRNAPRSRQKSLDELRAMHKWADAEDLALHVADLMRRGKRAVRQYLRDQECAHDVFVAFLAGFTTGTVIPPIRPSCVITLHMPTAGRASACTHPDCKHRTKCAGNRLLWADPKDPTQLIVHLPHHKTAGAAHGKPITFELPPQLNQLAIAYVGWAHGVLSDGAPQGLSHVFFNTQHGPLSPSVYTSWWKRHVLAGTGWDISPQLCRHIFVTEVMERIEDGRPAPRPADAAYIMGNSEEQWLKSYWLTSEQSMRKRARRAVADTGAMYAMNLLQPYETMRQRTARLKAEQQAELDAKVERTMQWKATELPLLEAKHQAAERRQAEQREQQRLALEAQRQREREQQLAAVRRANEMRMLQQQRAAVGACVDNAMVEQLVRMAGYVGNPGASTSGTSGL